MKKSGHRRVGALVNFWNRGFPDGGAVLMLFIGSPRQTRSKSAGRVMKILNAFTESLFYIVTSFI